MKLNKIYCLEDFTYILYKMHGKIFVIALIFGVTLNVAESLMFRLQPSAKKCLREEIHKDVLVSGDYEITEAPGQTVDLAVCILMLILVDLYLKMVDCLTHVLIFRLWTLKEVSYGRRIMPIRDGLLSLLMSTRFMKFASLHVYLMVSRMGKL